MEEGQAVKRKRERGDGAVIVEKGRKEGKT
jgi:hypothetical protein